MFKRDLEATLLSYARAPVVALLGPRQSGKTTLAKATFKNHQYTSLEDPKTRELALEAPERFFELYDNECGLIIDEFQHASALLSYIQLIVDTKARPGFFILTGSQNFLMNQVITQSLAGRVAILNLTPLSIHELIANNLVNESLDQLLINGCYPRVYAENYPPVQLYPSYIQTYIERDVRQLTQVGDLHMFQKFLKLCAGRIGQQLNLSEIGGVCGISVPTATRWLSILEVSYIVFLLQPHFNNFNKRLTSTPKLYFFDTGVACSLLDIETPAQLAIDRIRGHLFENFVIADLHKQYYNIGKQAPLYFWRDKNGRLEVDCIIEMHRQLIPIEIKSANNIALDFFTNLKDWQKMTRPLLEEQQPTTKSYLIYGGDKQQEGNDWCALGWQDAGSLISKLRAD